MRGRPADRLQREQTDERGEGRVVCPPAVQQARGELETLVAGEDGLMGAGRGCAEQR